ncbi:Hypothetical predicted protein [Podarcis lilfordi]|uniref:Uncharacterized protein n=1 Tax=Podarcis lilfordi TaxID=74358 RepID=A0AA35KHD8_9SAUR|nr:Hypothetical predicted protein [Podarcis lilfordi]
MGGGCGCCAPGRAVLLLLAALGIPRSAAARSPRGRPAPPSADRPGRRRHRRSRSCSPLAPRRRLVALPGRASCPRPLGAPARAALRRRRRRG